MKFDMKVRRAALKLRTLRDKRKRKKGTAPDARISLKEAEKWTPTIRVTPQSISCSVQQHSRLCLLVMAIAYTLRGAVRIEVKNMLIRFTYGGYRYVYELPEAILAKFMAFEDTGNSAPFKFRLGRPLSVREFSNRPPAKRRGNSGGATRRVPAGKSGRTPYGTGAYAKGTDKPRQTCNPTQKGIIVAGARRWHGMSDKLRTAIDAANAKAA